MGGRLIKHHPKKTAGFFEGLCVETYIVEKGGGVGIWEKFAWRSEVFHGMTHGVKGRPPGQVAKIAMVGEGGSPIFCSPLLILNRGKYHFEKPWLCYLELHWNCQEMKWMDLEGDFYNIFFHGQDSKSSKYNYIINKLDGHQVPGTYLK